MKTALLSVYNKEGIVEFAKELVNLNFKIYASGGTAKEITSAGIEVTDIASLVGGGPILGHRVVTLSREIHAGLLAKDTEEDRNELNQLKIPFIDLVCIDLYPLSDEIRKSENQKIGYEESRDAVIEKTDIGGPTLLRSAAKGGRVVICDPMDRIKVIDWLKNGEKDKDEFLNDLATKAEFIVANYALISAKYQSMMKYDGFMGQQILECKYGENGWQQPAGLFSSDSNDALSLVNFKLAAGTSPSYNNLADVDRLLQTATHIAAGFDVNFGKVPFLAVGVKHGNACGASIAEEPSSAIQKMLEGDLRAIFGGLVLVNFEIDEKLAEVLLTHQVEQGRRLLDGIIAPAFTSSAIETLTRKGDKCRFFENKALSSLSRESLDSKSRFRYVRGGFLRQPNYSFTLDFRLPDLEISGEISEKQKQDIILAWAVGSTSNSNTVTIVKDGQLIGNGVGQQDRVSGCELAIKRAGDSHHSLQNAIAFSDSFFPFVDGVEVLDKAGISALFATSGSVRDEEIKKFCADKGIALIRLPDSEARGFFGH